MYCKSIFFIVIDTTLASDKPLRFRKNLSERIWKLIMTIGDTIRDEKLQYDVNSEAVKTSAILSGKTDKYEYFTGEEILPPDQRRVIEQGNFTFSQLWKALERQIRTIEDQGRKKIKAVEDHWKQLVESNEIAKKEVNIDRDSVPLE